MIRRSLSSLTLRGRAFVAAGLTAIGCAVVLGQPAMTQVGVLVVALPLVAVVVVALRRTEPVLTRRVWPHQVRAGDPARVDLVITGDRRRRDGSLLVEDTVPHAFGGRPRFVLQGLDKSWQRSLTYPIRSDLRGQYVVGPLVVRVADPFGLVERRQSIGESATLTVTPRVLALPSIALAGGWQGAGEHRPQAFASGSAEDVSVREYRRGDDLRRVHWRSSARVGELMVRREEQPWEARATVLLDNRALAHRGKGAASSLEPAVVAAASMLVHLEQHGYAVRLVTADGIPVDGAARGLEHLALVGTSSLGDLDVTWSGEQARGGVVVAVLGVLHPDDHPSLRRIRHDAGSALAVVLDTEQWSATRTRTDPGVTVQHLAALSWRAVGVGPRDRLDLAWRDLGRSPARGGTRP